MIDLELLNRITRVLRALDEPAGGLIATPQGAGVNGDFGELVAASVFPLVLHGDPLHPGSDGFFADGRHGGKCLRGKTVEVKRYAKHPGYLDLKQTPPDYYLVVSGPKTNEKPFDPWAIESVFLFDGPRLHDDLVKHGVKIGEPTSIRKKLWDGAKIFPCRNPDYPLSTEQREALRLFCAR